MHVSNERFDRFRGTFERFFRVLRNHIDVDVFVELFQRGAGEVGRFFRERFDR